MTKKRRQDPLSVFLRLVVILATLTTVSILTYIVLYIIVKGIPYITPSLFALKYNSQNVSLFPAMMTTIIITAMALLIAVPVGIGTSIYLVEYARKGNRLVDIVDLTAETLAGIPSIVYGLFGLLFFVTTLNWGFSILSGACTLAIMILPLVIKTTEEALKSVPDLYREASFGLGAGKLRTVFKIVLPTAVPGILAGVILGIGRIVGETAALIYTAGTVAKIPKNIFSSGRTLSVHMYALSSEGLHTNQAYATALVLLLTVLMINTLSNIVARKLTKGR